MTVPAGLRRSCHLNPQFLSFEPTARVHGEVHPLLRPLTIDPHLLEWRLDPRSETGLPEASYDVRVLLLSGLGETSQRCAEDLRLLGLHRAVDVVGGFAAWLAAGLPIVAR